jgi:methionyl-tRNA formyltransferase
VIKYKYFYGSDIRSVPFLETIFYNEEKLKVITTKPKVSGRGKKEKPNPVENFCRDYDIEFSYYNSSPPEDMEYGISASFAHIFPESYLINPIFNIHLSILPLYKGPTPVETAILNMDSTSGYTIFLIDKDVDTGNIVYQKDIDLYRDTYASDFYKIVNEDFKYNYSNINLFNQVKTQEITDSKTKKFIKDDFFINLCNLTEAKAKIRAFNVLGPAIYKHNDSNLKIHSYTEEKHSFPILLQGKELYLEEVTPPGKKRMNYQDYCRGLK